MRFDARSYRKAYKWKRFGSSRIITVLLLNFVGALLSVLVSSYVIRQQLSLQIVTQNTDSYQLRIVVLCFLLYGLVFGLINYYSIILPLFELEDEMNAFMDLSREAGNQIITDDCSHINVLIAFRRLLEQQRNTVTKNKKLEKKQLNIELHNLQTQINPHFLYNALDSIRALAYYHDAEDIAEITESLSALFRNMISKEGKMLTLRQELNNIQDYIRIQLFHFNHRFKYRCEIDPELMDRCCILNMLLQPIVENAIMHGLERYTGMGEIVITAYSTERRLILNVTDNGVGIPEKELNELNQAFNQGANIDIRSGTKHTGIGLITINRRLKLQFGENYGLHVESTPNVRTNVELVLPLLLQRSSQKQ